MTRIRWSALARKPRVKPGRANLVRRLLLSTPRRRNKTIDETVELTHH